MPPTTRWPRRAPRRRRTPQTAPRGNWLGRRARCPVRAQAILRSSGPPWAGVSVRPGSRTPQHLGRRDARRRRALHRGRFLDERLLIGFASSAAVVDREQGDHHNDGQADDAEQLRTIELHRTSTDLAVHHHAELAVLAQEAAHRLEGHADPTGVGRSPRVRDLDVLGGGRRRAPAGAPGDRGPSGRRRCPPRPLAVPVPIGASHGRRREDGATHRATPSPGSAAALTPAAGTTARASSASARSPWPARRRSPRPAWRSRRAARPS